MRKYVYLALLVVLSGVMLSVVWAATLTSTSVTTSAMSDSNVEVWSSASSHQVPSWTPVEGVTAAIDTKGGIAHIKVPDGTGTWTVAVYLRNPDSLMTAYSFLNMEMEAVAAGTTGTPAALSYARSVLGVASDSAATWDFLTPEKGYVSFRVSASNGTLVGSERVFTIGIRSGSFLAKDTSTASNLNPSFYVEVRQ